MGTAPIGGLLWKFALPSIASFLVNAAYNIVDQIFIGQSVGMLGNAATNVAFPITTTGTALALLIGVGSASNFSLELGRGNKEKAGKIAGNGITLMAFSGIFLAIAVLALLQPLLLAFGATPNVLPLATTYTGITAVGIPFIIFTVSLSQLIRADGSPAYAMMCMVAGAVLNVILDAVFIFGLDMGIAGAAWATVISQFVSFIVALLYLWRFSSVELHRDSFRLGRTYVGAIAALGAAASFNQLAMTFVQIAMNNTLTHYGALSEYGSDIPLAVVGVISKVNIVTLAFMLGISQGNQPIVGFNYGAKNYGRVKEAYKKAVTAATLFSVVTFICFQIFPRQITSIFGGGSDLYFLFAEQYLRIFMFMTLLNGFQIVSSHFFTAIGKAKQGVLLSLTRQVIFLLPLILILPIFLGIDGVVYAGPISDGFAAAVALLLIIREFRKMDREIPSAAAQG